MLSGFLLLVLCEYCSIYCKLEIISSFINFVVVKTTVVIQYKFITDEIAPLALNSVLFSLGGYGFLPVGWAF